MSDTLSGRAPDGTGLSSTTEPCGLGPSGFDPSRATITDCGPDGGCEECDVCRYLNFLEWAGSVGKPDGSTIERNEQIERYLLEEYGVSA